MSCTYNDGEGGVDDYVFYCFLFKCTRRRLRAMMSTVRLRPPRTPFVRAESVGVVTATRPPTVYKHRCSRVFSCCAAGRLQKKSTEQTRTFFMACVVMCL